MLKTALREFTAKQNGYKAMQNTALFKEDMHFLASTKNNNSFTVSGN